MNIEKLFYKYRQSTKIAETRKDDLSKSLYPILAAFGIYRVGIESVNQATNGLEIDYGWSHRGNSSFDSITIPWEVIRADDPIKATVEFVAKRNQRKEDERKEGICRQIESLQRQL